MIYQTFWGFPFRVSIRKTFAQFLQNETLNFSFVAYQFCAKKLQFSQSFAKVISRKIALFPFSTTRVFPQFRNFVKIIHVYFLELKGFLAGIWILETSCFGMSIAIGHFYLFDQLTVKMSLDLMGAHWFWSTPIS